METACLLWQCLERDADLSLSIAGCLGRLACYLSPTKRSQCCILKIVALSFQNDWRHLRWNQLSRSPWGRPSAFFSHFITESFPRLKKNHRMSLQLDRGEPRKGIVIKLWSRSLKMADVELQILMNRQHCFNHTSNLFLGKSSPCPVFPSFCQLVVIAILRKLWDEPWLPSPPHFLCSIEARVYLRMNSVEKRRLHLLRETFLQNRGSVPVQIGNLPFIKATPGSNSLTLEMCL